MEIVFATNNEHKLREARRILGEKITVRSLADIGCHDDIPETADTLQGNALIKARWVFDRYGLPTFADDTGLMVDALDGAPGVYTARFAGEHCSPDDNIDKLLNVLADTPDNLRSARFSTVIAYISADGKEFTFDGSVEGSIAECRLGNDGFGYDPVFRCNETGLTFAQMGPLAKDTISHRGRAMRAFAESLTTLE
ncbi:MAG: RdgB/HAM1 family non-canonical purine NTP pyrophosphatase [Muribaculum sp.]|nr:RdgB/HAM1 family non-canonical purine NTP pyrophosphatase [Muribaculum sp.]